MMWEQGALGFGNATHADDSSSSSLGDKHSLVDGGIVGTLIVNSLLVAVGLFLFWLARWCLPSLYVGSAEKTVRARIAKTSARIQRYILKFPFGWLVVPLVASLPPARLRDRLSTNAFVFLVFQQLSWYFVICVSVLALAVVLPVNLLGHGLSGSRYSVTTIANMHEETNLYWVHVGALGVVLILVALFLFTAIVLLSRLDTGELRPVLPVVRLERIPREFGEADLQEALEAEFGAAPFVSFHVIRDLRKYATYCRKRAHAARRLEYWSATPELAAVRIRPSLLCFWRRVPAAAYYEQLVAALSARADAELVGGRGARSYGTAFVRLRDVQHARALVEVFGSVGRRRLWRREERRAADIQTTALPSKLQRWRAVLETSPANDVKFENLRFSRSQKAARRTGVFLLVCFYLFFFTSPTALLSSLKKVGHLAGIYPSEDSAYWLPFHSFFFGFLPALLQYFVAELLPELLVHLVHIEVWDSRMRALASASGKMLWYLFFGFVLFPSVQSVSVDAFYQQLRHSHRSWYERVSHTFLADSGGFFINYVLELALLGCIVDLLRIGQLAKWLAKRLYMKVCGGATPREKKEASLEEFDFVYRYATDQVVLGLCVVYSVAAPLLAPACFTYFLHRQFVDRYELICIDAEAEEEEVEEAVLFEVKGEESPTGNGLDPSGAPQVAPVSSFSGEGVGEFGLWSAGAPDSSAQFAERAAGATALPLGALAPVSAEAGAFGVPGYYDDEADGADGSGAAAAASEGRGTAAASVKKSYLNVQLLRRSALFVFVNLFLQQLLFFAFFSAKGNGYLMAATVLLMVLTLALFLVVRMLWYVSVTSRRPAVRQADIGASSEDSEESSPLSVTPHQKALLARDSVENYSWLDLIQQRHSQSLSSG